MLVTSTDLLKVVIAFVIVWIGVWVGFTCFYFAMMTRDIWFITKSIRKKIEAVEKVVTAFRGKVENTASYVPPLIEGVTKIIEAIAEKKRNSPEKGKKKK